MNNKDKYLEFCKDELNIPIFSQPWWLDAVCDEGEWDVAIVEKGGQIWATMPYYIRKRHGFTLITMPKLTQTLGPYIEYPENQKYYKRLSWEKELMNELIDQLPAFDYFYQQWNYRVTNWLPFYWRGFKQTTRYTYVINNEKNVNCIEDEYETDIRRRRRKAEREGVSVIEESNIDALYRLINNTFNRQQIDISFSKSFIQNIVSSCISNNACKMHFAKDKERNYIAANFLIEDNNSIYYLLGAIDASKKDLGGMDVIQHESIRYALSKRKTFDFEGSMVESIEKYFRSFGAVQKPYFTVTKTNSRILKIRECFKDILR